MSFRITRAMIHSTQVISNLRDIVGVHHECTAVRVTFKQAREPCSYLGHRLDRPYQAPQAQLVTGRPVSAHEIVQACAILVTPLPGERHLVFRAH